MLSTTRARSSRLLGRLGEPALVGALLLLYGLMALSGVWEKCTTYDEIAHLTSGYSYWLFGDYRLHPENGNLPQRWVALPLLRGAYRFPSRESPAWQQADVWSVGDEFFHDLGNPADGMLFQGRAMVVLLGMLVSSLVYAWSRSCFGRAGGILSLVLCVFCPTMLAQGSLVTSDMAATLFFLATVGGLWMVLHRVTPWTIAGSCLAMAGLFLAKMSAVFIIPVGLIMAVVRLVSAQPITLAWRNPWTIASRWQRVVVLAILVVVHGTVVWLALWTAFGFRFSAFRSDDPGPHVFYKGGWPFIHRYENEVISALAQVRDAGWLPEAYLYGFGFTEVHSRERRAFLNGEYGSEGWTVFFPYCLLVKTPLPLFAILGLASAAVVASWVSRSGEPDPGQWGPRLVASLYRSTPLLSLFLVYWGFALTSHLNIGQRHLLPTYPIMFIFAGAAAHWLRRRTGTISNPTQTQRETPGSQAEQGCETPGFASFIHPAAAVTTGLLLVWFVGESLRTWPHYLAYFNVLAGGSRNGYRHLVDSSLDWGQDLPGLKKWLDRNVPEGDGEKPVYLSYFGMARPEHYGIRTRLLPCTPARPSSEPLAGLTGGVYCISATMIQCVYVAAPGPWDDGYEKMYRQAQDLLRRYRMAESSPAVQEALLAEASQLPCFLSLRKVEWTQVIWLFEELRFARLCAYLRQRDPDDHVGYSILIYRLTDGDVRQAIEGPPPLRRPTARGIGSPVEY